MRFVLRRDRRRDAAYHRPRMRIFVPFLALAALAACAVQQPPPGPETSETSRRIDDSLVDAARTAEQRGDYQTAIGYYRGIYERDQANLEAVLGLSRSLRQMGRAKEARAIVERAMAKQPQDARLLAELGKAQLGADAPLDAIESLSKADALKPGDWEVNSALGVAYDRQGMYEQAERRYRQALQSSPDNVSVLNNLGLSLAQAGRLPAAIETLERAVSLPEATPQVRQNLALLYAMKGDLAATERLVRRDLSGELAEQNLAYYRRLSASLKAGARASLPAPILNSPPPPPPPAAAAAQAPVTVAAAPAPAEEKIPAAPEKIPEAVEKAPAAREKTPDAADKIPQAGERIAPADERAAPARQPSSVPDATPATPTEPQQRKPAEPPRSEQAPTPPAAAQEPAPADAVDKAATLTAPAAGSAPTEPAELPVPRPGPFRVQLGSFPTPEIADLGVGEVRKQHPQLLGEAKLEVVKASLPEKGDVYRIVTAPPSDLAAARALCEAVKTRGADCMLIRLP
jgi:Flp pilus assembly protein TadD